MEKHLKVWVTRSHEGAELLRQELEAKGANVKIASKARSPLTPDLLWAEACDYFQSVDDNPLYKRETIRGGERAGEVIKIEAPRPYTWVGLDEHLFMKGIVSVTNQFRHGDTAKQKEYESVVTAIEAVMRRNKFDGAAVGLFNPMIIARELGLMERTHNESVNINLDQKIDYSKLSTEALEEITALMDKQKQIE